MERFVAIGRVHARLAGRSLPIRGTRSFTPFHPNAIGLAPIRRTGDERLQAVAFGRLGEEPRLAVLLDPLESGALGLEELGEFLDGHVRDPRGCQVWLPDGESLRALSIEGARGQSLRLPAGRRRFGACCRALARIHSLPGQQVLVMATAVLGEHLVTGQSPSEDAHLGSRLAWDAPLRDVPPARLAAVRRRRPGPSLLPVADEDQVEAFRARMRSHPTDSAPRDEMAWLLRWAAEESWLLLEAAWLAYGRLSLPPLPGIAELEADTQKELSRLLEGVPSFSTHLGRAVAELGKREFWRERLEDLNARGDPVWREVFRREGRVVSATVERVRGRRILLRTGLGPRRVRVGTRLQHESGQVEGGVAAIRPDAQGAWLSVRVSRGNPAALPLGEWMDWVDTVVFRGRPPRVPQHAFPTSAQVPPAACPTGGC